GSDLKQPCDPSRQRAEEKIHRDLGVVIKEPVSAVERGQEDVVFYRLKRKTERTEREIATEYVDRDEQRHSCNTEYDDNPGRAEYDSVSARDHRHPKATPGCQADGIAGTLARDQGPKLWAIHRIELLDLGPPRVLGRLQIGFGLRSRQLDDLDALVNYL